MAGERYSRAAMIALSLVCALVWQQPGGAVAKPDAKPDAAAPSTTGTTPWDDKTAKAAVDEFAKVMKGTPSMLQKSRALDALAAGSNPLLLKALAEVVEKDKSIVIRKRAAELVAMQPEKDANTTLRALLKNPRVNGTPQVCAQLVRSLAACGYEAKQWAEVEGLFERDFAPECISLQEAVLDLAAKHKERAAIPLLLRNFGEPTPANVDAAHNPPKEYWEARWKAWSAWKGKVKDTLFAITGQRFNTAAEAEAWVKKNPQ